MIGGVLTFLGRTSILEGDPAGALPHLERALEIREQGRSPADDAAETRFVLAQALWLLGQDRPRARALAEAARKGYVDAGPLFGPEVAAVDRFLAEAGATP
ncbi:MAG: tetratricopeptide repeat protein [Myxococcales bacterium]|nr:tetratricopeptide repeat protein [Myxococcales bacterium]